jgi:CubicO group peptidase (beta-lactamase class C family)
VRALARRAFYTRLLSGVLGERAAGPAFVACLGLLIAHDGCAPRPAEHPLAVVEKGPPSLVEAETVVSEFLAAANGGDAAAMPAFFAARWSAQVPPPPAEERALRRETVRAQLGRLDARPVFLTPHGASVLACAERDGWISVDFVFEAAPPRKVVGIRARPAPAPPGAGACGRVTPPRTESELAEALDTYVESRAEFSGIVLLGKGGAPLFTKAIGLAVREGRIPNLADTKFNVGSVSKMFTALAIAQLADAGRLRFADPVRRYLPSFGPPQLEPATLAHLLTHTSGLGDVFRPPFRRERIRLREPKDYIDVFGGELLEFPPGTRGRYSNLGYMALGRVVEQVTGQSYETYLREHVWVPAGMNDTSNAPYDAPLPNRAQGYTHRTPEGRWTREERPNDSFNLVKGSPAGCTVSTAPDLLRLATALGAGTIVSDATLARMTAGHVVLEVPGGFIDGMYGYGFIEEFTRGVRHFGHGGGLPGANAYVEILPESSYSIVVLANEDPPEATWVGDRILMWLVALATPMALAAGAGG